jgi:hypothetical protein
VTAGPAPRRLKALHIDTDPSGWLSVDAGREVAAGTRKEVRS